MVKYDILQLDDDEKIRSTIKEFASSKNLSYHGVGSLHEFKCLFNSGGSGKVCIIDGNFPESPGEFPEALAESAINLLQSQPMYNRDNVLLFSSGENVLEICNRHKLGGAFSKGEHGIDLLEDMIISDLEDHHPLFQTLADKISKYFHHSN